jgi:hypothetical protein
VGYRVIYIYIYIIFISVYIYIFIYLFNVFQLIVFFGASKTAIFRHSTCDLMELSTEPMIS